MNKIIKTSSAEETRLLGEKIGQALNDPSIVLVDGDLAAGKTTLTQGIAKALGVKRVVNSPSFTIMKHYRGDKSELYHLDLYRLDNVGYDFDLEEYFDLGITVIEWPFQVEELLPSEYLLVKINKTGDDKREFELIASGPKYEEVIKCID